MVETFLQSREHWCTLRPLFSGGIRVATSGLTDVPNDVHPMSPTASTRSSAASADVGTMNGRSVGASKIGPTSRPPQNGIVPKSLDNNSGRAVESS